MGMPGNSSARSEVRIWVRPQVRGLEQTVAVSIGEKGRKHPGRWDKACTVAWVWAKWGLFGCRGR